MNARQFATTLRRTPTRRAGCSLQRGLSSHVDSGVSEDPRMDAEALTQQPQAAHRELPEGMQRVLSMKEKRTKFQRLSMP
jgi:hypothetical protein